jgi:hypothetical protein
MKQVITDLAGIVFLAAFGLGGVVMTRDLVRALQSRHWPTTTGTVVTSIVEKKGSSRPGSAPAYFGRVSYRYQVGGVTHTASQVSFGEHGESGTGHAKEVVARYPAGSQVKVHYRPDSPAVAVLEPGAGFFNWIMPLVCLLVCPGSLILWLVRRLVAGSP